MGNNIRTEFYLKSELLTERVVNNLLVAFEIVGFSVDQVAHGKANYDAGHVYSIDNVNLTKFKKGEPVTFSMSSPSVLSTRMGMSRYPVQLSFHRTQYTHYDNISDASLPSDIANVGLYSVLSWCPDRWFPFYWIAWSSLIAHLLPFIYGWSGDEEGLSGRGKLDMTRESIVNTEAQQLEWCNYFGLSYVKKIGFARLLSAPAAQVQALSHGGVAVIVNFQPYEIDATSAKDIAEHLGMLFTQ